MPKRSWQVLLLIRMVGMTRSIQVTRGPSHLGPKPVMRATPCALSKSCGVMSRLSSGRLEFGVTSHRGPRQPISSPPLAIHALDPDSSQKEVSSTNLFRAASSSSLAQLCASTASSGFSVSSHPLGPMITWVAKDVLQRTRSAEAFSRVGEMPTMYIAEDVSCVLMNLGLAISVSYIRTSCLFPRLRETCWIAARAKKSPINTASASKSNVRDFIPWFVLLSTRVRVCSNESLWLLRVVLVLVVTGGTNRRRHKPNVHTDSERRMQWVTRAKYI